MQSQGERWGQGGTGCAVINGAARQRGCNWAAMEGRSKRLKNWEPGAGKQGNSPWLSRMVVRALVLFVLTCCQVRMEV